MRRGPIVLARRPFLLGLGALLATAPARALDPPRGPVVLTLSGRVRRANLDARAQFDMPMLAALPQRDVVTKTPWYTTARKFTGPLLRDVLSAAGADGQHLRAHAINDYRVDIPVDDAVRWDVVMARLLDDKPMAVRDKGPLFIIYPFDAHPELRNAVYFSRCAWQLKAIEVA